MLDKADYPNLGIEVDKSKCIIWKGAMTKAGYPLVFRDGKTRLYQRVLWASKHGRIPEGMCVCHRCDNKSCVNINHYFLATHQENMIDKVLKGRMNTCKGEDHPLAKLNAKSVREIRVLFATGKYKHGQLAEKYGVTRICVYKVVKRATWKHVK